VEEQIARQLVMLLLVAAGGGNDLLDCVSTNDFWSTRGVTVSVDAMLAELEVGEPSDIGPLIAQLGSPKYAVRRRATKEILAKGPLVISQLQRATASRDAEIARRASAIIEQLGHGQRTKAARVLMAIRTLGELADPRAEAILRRYLESDKPFRSLYAKRALAAIAGNETVVTPRPPEDFDEDIRILPPGTGTVAQATVRERFPKSFREVLADLARIDVPVEGEDFDDVFGARKLQPRLLQSQYDALVDEIGNARLDAVTVGVSSDVGFAGGFIVVVFHGHYDKEAVKRLFARSGWSQKSSTVWMRCRCLAVSLFCSLPTRG
jgi:hypothetical protein